MYDPVMAKHGNEVNPSHPETSERITQTWQHLEAEGLTQRCEVMEVRCY